MRWALAAWMVALIVPAAAGAHVTIAPPFVEEGAETAIAFQTPNERPPHATISLTVTAPRAIAIVSAPAVPGWQATVSGPSATWSGGRLAGRATTSFPLHITARARPGTYDFAATQRYDDGASVEWNAALSVLPATGAAAPKQHPWGAVAAALAGIAVIAGGLLGLRHFRRRPLQEQ